MTKHVIFLSAVLLVFVSVLSYAQAPVPFVNQPLVPDVTAPGGPQFTLTVNGTGFVSSSVVNWNGNALATQFVSGSQLTATVPAANIATPNTGWVTVVNPAPGGGTSNLAFFPVTANTGNSVGFVQAWTPPAGYHPNGMPVGDFNGDGKLDLAVANYYSDTVSILLGDGTGNFTLFSTPQVGDWPQQDAVGDFNGDGKLDLATANTDSNTVSILLGDGTGNFTLFSSPAVGNAPWCVVVGDFNGDGKLDLAVANRNDNTVSILLGDGTGNFTVVSTVAVGIGPIQIVVGDFNGDGKLDLATANGNGGNTVSVLLGDGTGNFTLASSPAVGDQPWSIGVGDFNGDGKLDLATANAGSNTLSILLGDGTGNFTLVSSPAVGSLPFTVAIGDFNGDGIPDIATANYNDDTVSVLLGDGTGNFTVASTPTVGSGPGPMAVGDFNGDGKLDLAVGNINDNTLSILLGTPLLGPYVTYNPTSLTFGVQLLGTSSSPQPVTFTNIGSATLDITRVVISANFSQTNNCPHKLPVGGQCTANVVFTPHNINTINGTITITDNATNSPQTIPLTGVGTVVTLLPSSLNFGDQQVGTVSPPQFVTLTNYAPKPVTIFGGNIIGKGFRLQNTTCGHSLPGAASCTVNIVFAPKSKGGKGATLEVNDSGGASPQTVALSGTGTP